MVATTSPERPSDAYHRVRLSRARWAVGAIFFQQGFLVGGWALQIPVLLDRLGITESVMGLLIVAFGLGSIVAMLAVGPVIDRTGSRKATRWAALASAPLLVLVNLTPDVWTTGVLLALGGATIGVVDVAMNANAVEVERRYGRAIMSSFHAYWSLGTLFGALLSGPIIAAVGGLGHGALFTLLLVALALIAWPHFVRERLSSHGKKVSFQLPRVATVWLLGAICLFGYVPEGAAIDWSALYMREEIGVPITLAGFALAGMQVTMTLMRFAGDRIRDRIGAEATLRYGGLIGTFGLLLVGSAGMAWAADWSAEARAALVVLGFVTVGIGLANIVPVAFAAAGSIPGVASGTALSVIAMHGYAGILLAPSIIGWAGERIGFGPVYALIAVLPLATAVMARSVLPKHTHKG